jgi:hypothetical protein
MAMSVTSEVNWHNPENMQKAGIPATPYNELMNI